ncbi:MAG TPA: YciI family protein [Thermoanaerobaculia bacterium]|nr:YciI family protein [Thermoanaerobaculia bacterium]
MRYLLLIYDAESKWASMSEEDRGRMFQEYMSFTDSIKKSGHWIGGDPLQPTTTATTVRVRNGKPATTDGPFAETREQLGGFYMIQASNLDEATGIAARVPSARIGSIEVRPIMEMHG